MRRMTFGLVVGVLAVTGCTGGARVTTAGDAVTSTSAAPEAPPLLYVGSPTGLAAVRPDSGAVVFSVTGAVAAPDWSRLWRAAPGAAGTDVDSLDAATGAVTAAGAVARSLVVRTVSGDGRSVALTEASEAASYPQLAVGRSSTPLAIARLSDDGTSVSTDEWTVTGNVEPDAFFADGSLAVIDLTPAEAPTGYRVRRFDPSTGLVTDIETDADDDMTGGSARTHVYSPDGSHLFTYYRVVDAEGTRAFIHVLDLRHPSAHCVDLPVPFGASGPYTTTLATSADGRHLYVADTATGKVADVDTVTRSVLRVADTGPGTQYGYGSAATDGNGNVYLSDGLAVWSLDLATLTRGQSFAVATPNSVTALRMSPTGAAQVYAGMLDRVAVLDLGSGAEVRTLPSPWAGSDTDPIQFLGPASPPLAAALTSFQCAC